MRTVYGERIVWREYCTSPTWLQFAEITYSIHAAMLEQTLQNGQFFSYVEDWRLQFKSGYCFAC